MVGFVAEAVNVKEDALSLHCDTFIPLIVIVVLSAESNHKEQFEIWVGEKKGTWESVLLIFFSFRKKDE